MDANSGMMNAAVMPPEENQWAGAQHEGGDYYEGDYGNDHEEQEDLGEEAGDYGEEPEDYGEEGGELDEEALEELGEDIRTYIQEAERAIDKLVSSYDIDQLKDQEIWDLVEGFMERIVGPLHDLEVAHADNKPGFADNFQQMEEENGEYGDVNGEDEDENGEDEEYNPDEKYNPLEDGFEKPASWLRQRLPVAQATEAY